MQRPRGHLVAALDRVVGVHQHLGLDDRNESRLLAERRVAGERVRVRADAARRDGMPSPIVITARHFAKRAPSPRYSSSRARRPSRPSVTFSPGKPAMVVRARVHLDPRDRRPSTARTLGERRAVVGRLADRLVVQDHAADELLHARGREEQLAVGAAALLGRLDADRVEALLDRARATRRRRGSPCGRRRSPCAVSCSSCAPISALLSSGSGSSSSGWEATMRRTVPDRERITIDSVSTRSPTTRTPRSSAPLVTPVAATNTSSPCDEVVRGQHPVEVVAGVDAVAAAPRRSAARAFPASRRRGT